MQMSDYELAELGHRIDRGEFCLAELPKQMRSLLDEVQLRRWQWREVTLRTAHARDVAAELDTLGTTTALDNVLNDIEFLDGVNAVPVDAS